MSIPTRPHSEPFFLGLVVGDMVASSIWPLLFLAFNIPGYRTLPI